MREATERGFIMSNKEKDYPFIDINELKPYKNNARLHPQDQIDKIVNSINEFGFITPVIIDEDNTILVGHGRTQAAKQAGITQVPYRRITNLTDEQKRAYILADNKLSDIAEWDEELLQIELDKINLDMTAFGFEEFEIDIEEEKAEIVEDEIPEAPAEPKAKAGNIYKLGKHRLMCGDSTDADHVKQLFDGVQPFAIVTDPPYCSGGFQEAGKRSGSIGTRDKIMIANDTLSTRGYMALIKSVIKAAGDVGIVYAFTDWRMYINLFDTMESSGFGMRNMIVWNKGSAGMGVGWRAQHELCIMASRSAQKFNPHKAQGNVITCNRTGNVNHPTEKPVELISKIIDVTDFAEEIYDPFSGSGTTLIACEQLGRTCYAMEIDPQYVDVIIKRWENLTGLKAELIKGVE